tara:strand:- start:661 stop:1818 length:1158 start_codon:yes stop_codon:yes gene_type:complete
MHGEVEIWKGDTLLYKEPNMLVDGAGELLADAMTVSPSLSAIADHATSSILDSSNYTIQAISFGTGSDAFNNSDRNAQSLSTAKFNYLVDIWDSAGGQTYGPVALAFQQLEGYGKSYVPDVGLPEAPNPASRVLENNTSVSAAIPVGGVDVSVSSLFPGNGQHVNFMPSAIGSGMMESTAFSSIPGTGDFYPSSLGLAQSVLGAFPIGSSTQAGMTKATTRVLAVDTANITKATTDTFGFFNEVSSMDVSGFVNMIMSGSPGTTTSYAMSSGASGLCVSGGLGPVTRPDFGIVEYTIMLAGGDMATANLYGGIYHLGLWTIDMEASLLNGNTPPFAFSVLNNPRKYKLFARKGLSKNLCYINDHGANLGFDNHTELTIKWRLHFL